MPHRHLSTRSPPHAMGTLVTLSRDSVGPLADSAPFDRPASAARPTLAAVDVADGFDAGLARRILAAARETGRGPLHVVHAWHLVGESVLACSVRGIGRARLRRIRRSVQEERRARLEALTRGMDAELHLVHGRAARGIRRVARRIGAGLVVMGAPAPPPLPGVVLGGMAEVLAGEAYSLFLVARRGERDPTPSRPRLHP